MCGRYTITVVWEDLVIRFMLDRRAGKFQPRYNVAPGQYIPAIIGGTPPDGEGPSHNRFGELKWGLVPSWASDERSGYRMMNARSETVAEKPAFRNLLKRKRCVIPADGFYEWKRTEEGKQPYRFTLRDGALFAMAALYDTWVSPSGEKLHTCTIVTTAANGLVSDVHDRMPVILTPRAEALWLDRLVQDERELVPLLAPYPAEAMRRYAVSPKVGNVRYDSPDCVEPV